MHNEYIEERNGGYYVAGTRISLESVVFAFNQRHSPERILEKYPMLDKLARVYGAIAFYLDHQAEVDAYLERIEREYRTSLGTPLSQSDPALWNRLQRAGTNSSEPRP